MSDAASLHPLLAPRARPRLMGVVNVTPDSFSDGGRHLDPDAALAHGRALAADGADILDVGGESTRPGATRPLVSEELDRVLPVISGLAAEGLVVSVDTMRAEVAEAAIAAGAQIVNDVSGGLADPRMLDVVAASEAVYVAMHWRGHSDRMADRTDYLDAAGVPDVVGVVCAELNARIEAAYRAGIGPERLVADPGLGFAKTAEQNWQLLDRLDALAELGPPLLIGASRKSFLGALLADPDGTPRPVSGRDDAGTALTTYLALQGVWGIRNHEVRASADALQVAVRLRQEAVTDPQEER